MKPQLAMQPIKLTLAMEQWKFIVQETNQWNKHDMYASINF